MKAAVLEPKRLRRRAKRGELPVGQPNHSSSLVYAAGQPPQAQFGESYTLPGGGSGALFFVFLLVRGHFLFSGGRNWKGRWRFMIFLGGRGRMKRRGHISGLAS
jgi:hypothetical protein